MDYIVDFKPIIIEDLNIDKLTNIEEKLMNNIAVTEKEINYFLDTLNYLARKKINPSFDDYSYKCDLAQSILCNYLQKINCCIYPCTTQSAITNNIEGHNFTVAKFNIKDKGLTNILLDPTYIQFFKKENCQRNSYVFSPKIPQKVLITPNPGYFVKKEDLKKIQFLLDHGFAELNYDIARIYGDSFYNTKTGKKINDLAFQSIPGRIYINSFIHEKGKIYHSEEYLKENGYMIDLFRNSKYGKKL